jgi:molybdopterin/thiamine biosynthesis adenylyltransferase
VALVGAGSVGATLATHFARLQINELQIVDPAVFKPASILTHPILPYAVGASKAEHWGKCCKAISPRTRVRVFAGPVQHLPLDAFADVDRVVMAPDNLAVEVDVGQRCLSLGKELHQAAVHGETLVARNSVWTNRGGAGPCPACGFGEQEVLLYRRQTRFTCSGPDGLPTEEQVEVVPTTSVSFLCGLAAEQTMVRLLRSVLELGPASTDSVLEYCGYNHKITASPLRRNSECPCEHVAWTMVASPRPLAECSPAEMDRMASVGGAAASDLSFVVDDLTFVQSASCCGRTQPVGRFLRAGQPAGHCTACGQPMPVLECYSHRPVAANVVGTLMTRPLAELGAETARCVVVRGGASTALLRHGLA